MSHWLIRLFRHRLLDESDARRVFTPQALQEVQARVAASESRHSGQIRICVEAGLPLSYLRGGATPRDRAVALFGKLRVWDTEHNDGVLIYLLLAERAIEIVADRGIARRVGAAEWTAIAAQMRATFQAGDFAAGLDRAIDAVDALLVCHFPREKGEGAPDYPNELPDAPTFA